MRTLYLAATVVAIVLGGLAWAEYRSAQAPKVCRTEDVPVRTLEVGERATLAAGLHRIDCDGSVHPLSIRTGEYFVECTEGGGLLSGKLD